MVADLDGIAGHWDREGICGVQEPSMSSVEVGVFAECLILGLMKPSASAQEGPPEQLVATV
jgi:hypothetical protein